MGTLSGGERNRVLLAKVLSSGGNVLLLDEPTNDLDVDTLRALEDALVSFPGCAVVISHDRWFLDRIATHVLAFEGDSEARWCEGNFSDYEADRRKRLGAEAEQPHRLRYKPLVRATECFAGDPTPAVASTAPTTSSYAVTHGGPSATQIRGGSSPAATRTRHDERVPNPSRCTQFAALGRSSPSGVRWSASARRKALDDARHPMIGSPSVARTRSTFSEGSASARFSSTWMPGGRATAVPSAGPVKSTKNKDVRSPTSSHEPL